jgi:predicted Zn-ribbon and HTH transcriptional regulator
MSSSGTRIVMTYTTCYRCGQFFEESYQKLHTPPFRPMCPICAKKPIKERTREMDGSGTRLVFNYKETT